MNDQRFKVDARVLVGERRAGELEFTERRVWAFVGFIKAPNGPAACRAAKVSRRMPIGYDRLRARLCPSGHRSKRR